MLEKKISLLATKKSFESLVQEMRELQRNWLLVKGSVKGVQIL
jgi:hypothetical protein